MIKDKIVVITGASSGLGSELGRQFAQKGATVVLLARNKEKLDELERQILIEGGSAWSTVLDITHPEAVDSVFREIQKRFEKIDILINCAGLGNFQLFNEMKFDSMKRMFAVNVMGLIACTRAALPLMLQSKQGHLVNIASIAGKITTPKSVVYGATKHAVIGFSDGLRMELEHEGIRVTVVNPGPIRTPFLKFADPSGNYAKKAGRYMLDPRSVAEKILKAVEQNKREINLPRYMGIGAKLYQIFPGFFEKVFGTFLKMK